MFLTFSFLFGMLIGSFLNVVIYRLPRGENIAFPPSHCPKCGWKIKPLENIPVISYIFLRGKCSNCKNKISPIYPFIELLTGILFAFCYWQYSFTTEGYISVVFISIMICIFFIDLEHYIIPDSLLAVLLILSALKIFLLNQPQFLNAVITTVITFLFFYLVYILSKEKFGGGDVKLFTLLALYFGWPLINLLIVLASVLGLIIAGVMIMAGVMNKDEPIPFGPFIVFSSIITLFYGEIIWNFYEKIILVLLL